MENSISGRIKSLLKENNITPYKLCKETGIGEGTFSRSIKTEDTWKLQHIKNIASYFKVSIDWLVNGNMGYNRDILIQDISNKDLKIKKIPIVTSVSCGLPLERWQGYGNKFLYISDLGHYDEPFILIAEGDSMEPEIRNKDMLLCSTIPDITNFKNGKIGVVSLKTGLDFSEGMVKLITFINDQVILSSLNKEYPPYIFRKSDIYQIYNINHIIRKLK